MITVLGASGFIGAHVVHRARELGLPCRGLGRGDTLPRSLGQVVYCIGLTADFRTQPFETVRAHVSRLLDVVEGCEFERLVYLSSTRVYRGDLTLAQEGTRLELDPTDPSDLYNLSKAMGEAIALACGERAVVARLSNVYGSDVHSRNFLSQVICSAVRSGAVELQTTLDSCKDYVSIHDVVELLLAITRTGMARVYNIASGQNTTNQQIAERLGVKISVAPAARRVVFPTISISRVREEFGFTPRSLLEELPGLVTEYERVLRARA